MEYPADDLRILHADRLKLPCNRWCIVRSLDKADNPIDPAKSLLITYSNDNNLLRHHSQYPFSQDASVSTSQAVMASATGIPQDNPVAEGRGEEEPLLGRAGDVSQQDGKGIQFNFFMGTTLPSIKCVITVNAY